jgi:transposase-like protein
MSRKRYPPEQIIGKLREAEVALAQGQTAAQVCRILGLAEQTFYRRRWSTRKLRQPAKMSRSLFQALQVFLELGHGV